jgi:aldose 1-epimerase
MIKVEKKKVDTNLGEIDLISMKSSDMEVVLTSYGAAVYSIKVLGNLVTVAPQQFDLFFRSPFFYGKTIGRTSGRLILPSYQIDHAYYPIKPFRGDKVKLHGGPSGFSYRHFKTLVHTSGEDEGSVSFMYQSMHMEEEFPGELKLIVTYKLTKSMGLNIMFEATSDHDTLCNITNHTYFNLSTSRTNILDHQFQIHADHYLEIDQDNIVLSKKSVKDTLFDFNVKTNLGERIKKMQLTPFNGFDHTWLFNNQKTKMEIDEPSSPVKLIVETSYPAVVIYTHNYPSPTKLEQFKHDGTHSSFTLECQFEPGGIHFPYLNSAILRKNELYKHHILYQFVEK